MNGNGSVIFFGVGHYDITHLMNCVAGHPTYRSEEFLVTNNAPQIMSALYKAGEQLLVLLPAPEMGDEVIAHEFAKRAHSKNPEIKIVLVTIEPMLYPDTAVVNITAGTVEEAMEKMSDILSHYMSQLTS